MPRPYKKSMINLAQHRPPTTGGPRELQGVTEG